MSGCCRWVENENGEYGMVIGPSPEMLERIKASDPDGWVQLQERWAKNRAKPFDANEFVRKAEEAWEALTEEEQ